MPQHKTEKDSVAAGGKWQSNTQRCEGGGR
jgi:hypothetical protein